MILSQFLDATLKTLDSDRTREILRKVRQIEIRTRRLVTDALAGAYHSSFKGQGMDFDEVREYAAGDDIRSIDWNVTARMNTPFIKKFREERELTILLAVDLSASGSFSSNEQTIRDLAAEIASVLAFSATRNDDKVGVLLFTDRIEKFIRPEKGRHHILRLIREVLFHEPEGKGTDLPSSLMHCVISTRFNADVLSSFSSATSFLGCRPMKPNYTACLVMQTVGTILPVFFLVTHAKLSCPMLVGLPLKMLRRESR